MDSFRIFIYSALILIVPYTSVLASEVLPKMRKQNILEKKSDAIILLEETTGHYFMKAFTFLYGTNQGFEEDPEKAEDNLKIQALKYPYGKNLETLYNLNKAAFNRPIFIKMFSEALDWAEQEKQKSAQELYETSSTIMNNITDTDLKHDFRMTYLKLALDKGSKTAKSEYFKRYVDHALGK